MRAKRLDISSQVVKKNVIFAELFGNVGIEFSHDDGCAIVVPVYLGILHFQRPILVVVQPFRRHLDFISVAIVSGRDRGTPSDFEHGAFHPNPIHSNSRNVLVQFQVRPSKPEGAIHRDVLWYAATVVLNRELFWRCRYLRPKTIVRLVFAWLAIRQLSQDPINAIVQQIQDQYITKLVER